MNGQLRFALAVVGGFAAAHYFLLWKDGTQGWGVVLDTATLVPWAIAGAGIFYALGRL